MADHLGVPVDAVQGVLNCYRVVTEQGNVIRIRPTVDVEVFRDTVRASKGAFKDEINGIVEQCWRHGIALLYARLHLLVAVDFTYIRSWLCGNGNSFTAV